MENGGTSPSSRPTQTQGWSSTSEQSGCTNGYPVRAQDRHPMGDAAAGNGLWQWHDLLAASAGLATSGSMGEAPSGILGTSLSGRPDRLVKSFDRLRQCPCPRGGEKTGPNPTDRRKSGSKRHIVVERKGIPLVIRHTAANVCDITMLLEMVDAIPQLPCPDGKCRNRPEKLHGDKGYDSNRHRQALTDRGIIHRLGRRRIDKGVRLGKHRWVVERTLSWLNRYRRLSIRYERREDIHQAFLSLASALICWRFVQKFC